MNEESVKRRVWEEFRRTYDENEIKTEQVITPEESEVRWRSDVVVNSDEGKIAIECKGSHDHRRGIGQALSYKLFCDEAGFAGFRLSKPVQILVNRLPIGGMNVLENKIYMIPFEPRKEYKLVDSERVDLLLSDPSNGGEF